MALDDMALDDDKAHDGRVRCDKVYMVGLRVVDTMMTQGPQTVELRAISMNFPKKSKVRPG